MKKNKDFIIVVVICVVLIFISLYLLFSGIMEVSAAVITGEKHLAGGSYWIEQYVKATGHSPYTEDIELLAETIYHENYCNGIEAMELTGSVVINRVNHPDYPNTVKEVLYQKGQYSTTGKFYTRELPKVCYEIALRLLKEGSVAPGNVIFQSMFFQGSRIYKKINTDYFCYE